MRLSNTTVLYRRFATAEAVILKRLLQLAAVEAKLADMGIAAPTREEVAAPAHPEIPTQFGAKAGEKRERSVSLVAAAIKLLKATTHKSRSPSKREIADASRRPEVDREGVGVTTNVFRTNQTCLDLYLEACLPAHAERRKSVAVPSWAVHMEHDALVALVASTEADRDQLTRFVMAANEAVIAPEVVRIRRLVVKAKADRMVSAVD